jgi:hypothetical protein
MAQGLSNFATYENSTYGVRIDYPLDWNVTEGLSPENIVAFHNPASDLRYIENVIPTNYTGLGIFFQNLSSLLGYENMSLDSFSALQLDTLDSDSIAISKFDNTTLAGIPAHIVEYYDTSGPDITTQVWTVKDGNAYVIISIGDRLYHMQDKASLTTQAMIKSFNFTK